MLFLLFQVGDVRYALDTAAVLEIVPRVALKAVRAAPGVAGLLDYHAAPVPVLDLSALANGQPAQARFSTRLILVQTAAIPEAGGRPHVLGLLAERATSLLQRQPAEFTRTGLHLADAPYLGPVTSDGQGFIHRVEVDGLLSGAVRALFQHGQEAALTS